MLRVRDHPCPEIALEDSVAKAGVGMLPSCAASNVGNARNEATPSFRPRIRASSTSDPFATNTRHRACLLLNADGLSNGKVRSRCRCSRLALEGEDLSRSHALAALGGRPVADRHPNRRRND